MRKLEETEAFKEIGVTLNRYDFKEICDKMEFDSDLYWDCILRHWGITGYHPVSTCRMGSKTDPTAVVDPQLRYNLYHRMLAKKTMTFREWI